MQRDVESCPNVVYFHMNIPGVDSYSLVWRAEIQCNNFQTPDTECKLPLTLVWDSEEWLSYSRFHLDDSSWKWGPVKQNGLYIHLSFSPGKRWDVWRIWQIKRGRLRVTVLVLTRGCFFGRHRRLTCLRSIFEFLANMAALFRLVAATAASLEMSR